MSKVLGVIAFFISIICIIVCTISIFISINTYDKNEEKLNTLERKVNTLEKELSTALGYDITDEEAGNTSGEYDISSFQKIKPIEIKKLSTDKKIVVWIGRQGCSYCSLYAPTIKKVSEEYGVKAHYIDLSEMYDTSTGEWVLADQEGYDFLVNMEITNSTTQEIMNEFGATPMTLIIENNKIINGIMGAVDKDTLSEIFKDEGFKK